MRAVGQAGSGAIGEANASITALVRLCCARVAPHLRRGLRSILLLSLVWQAASSVAQSETSKVNSAVTKPSGSVTAALLSDPHLDPFRDPGKVKRLAAAPVSAWAGILAEPPTTDQAEAFQKLQAGCSERLPDADASLELSAFDSAQAAHPAFVLVAGDLLVHGFVCRYRALLDPSGSDTAGLAEFAAKTVEFQLQQLRQRFPNTPVHLALGNNDSDCEDYSLDESSRFLERLAPAVSSLWAGVGNRERSAAVQDFKHFGSYVLPLSGVVTAAGVPARLLVLDDLYLSSDYRGTCGKKSNGASATALLTWVERQLAHARRTGAPVWVLGHIPPTVNIYRTYLHPRDICHGEAPVHFFQSDAFSTLLVRYADTVRVFVSGHTHLDEIHLLEGQGTAAGSSPNLIALKTIPSLSPISTNPPAYLLATVDAKRGTLLNYELRSFSGDAGPRWMTAYRFQQSFHEPAFDAASVAEMLKRWQSGTDAAMPEINTYQTHLASGLRLLALRASWPQQVCAMQHSAGAAFAQCACAADSGLLPPVQPAK